MTTPRVLVLAAASSSWLEPEEEDPSPSGYPWTEVWEDGAADRAGSVDGTAESVHAAGAENTGGVACGDWELVVVPPGAPLAAIEGWRRRFPDAGVVVVVDEADDRRMRDLLGDEGVFFLWSPADRPALRAGLREVLSFRSALRELAEAGQRPPAFEETAPVSGWLEITAASHPVFLRRFRAWLEALDAVPLGDDERRRLVHAVREVGWNALEWGNRFDPARRLELSYLVLEDRVLLRVQDEGDGHDWTRGVADDAARDAGELQGRRRAQGLRPGGLGLRLVRQAVDRVEVSSRGNIVVLEKHFQPLEERVR